MNAERDRIVTLLEEIRSPYLHRQLADRARAHFEGLEVPERAAEPPRPPPTPLDAACRAYREGAMSSSELLDRAREDGRPQAIGLVVELAAQSDEGEVLSSAVEALLAAEPVDAIIIGRAVERITACAVAGELPLTGDDRVAVFVRLAERARGGSYPEAAIGASLVGLAHAGAVDEVVALLSAALRSDADAVDHAGDLASAVPFGEMARFVDARSAARVWRPVVEEAERTTDPFRATDLLTGLCRLPGEQVRPHLQRVEACLAGLEPTHRTSQVWVSLANAQLALGLGGESAFARALDRALPSGWSPTVPRGRALSDADLVLTRAEGHLRVDDLAAAKALAERAMTRLAEAVSPHVDGFVSRFARLGFYDLAARLIDRVDPTYRDDALVRGAEPSIRPADISPVVEKVLAMPPLPGAIDAALALCDRSGRAWEHAFAHRSVNGGGDWVRSRLIEAALATPPPNPSSSA